MTEEMRTRAGDLVMTAARIRAEELGRRAGPYTAPGLAYADRIEARGWASLPESMAERGAGGELIPIEAFGYKAPELCAKVEAPTWVEAEASRDRLQAAEDAPVASTPPWTWPTASAPATAWSAPLPTSSPRLTAPP